MAQPIRIETTFEVVFPPKAGFKKPGAPAASISIGVLLLWMEGKRKAENIRTPAGREDDGVSP